MYGYRFNLNPLAGRPANTERGIYTAGRSAASTQKRARRVSSRQNAAVSNRMNYLCACA